MNLTEYMNKKGSTTTGDNDMYPWTKLVVPSRGSTIHVGSSVNSTTPKAAVVSSPMN